jgi:hypothetical protein
MADFMIVEWIWKRNIVKLKHTDLDEFISIYMGFRCDVW